MKASFRIEASLVSELLFVSAQVSFLIEYLNKSVYSESLVRSEAQRVTYRA
jgi:hypothetical protein